MIASTYGGGKTATEISQVEAVIPAKPVGEEIIVAVKIVAEIDVEVNIKSVENTNVGGISEDPGEVLLHAAEPKVIREASRGVAALMKQMKQNKNSGKKGRKQRNKGGGVISNSPS
ncbi:hypothetical protein V6N13_103471 [Hibiscus sabdariffa]